MKELSMHYSFRNTLCSLAVLVAAGLLAETASAQGTVTLLADEEDEISLAPDAGIPVSADISLDVSIPGSGGLITPNEPTVVSAQSDVIPMESGGISLDFDDTGSSLDVQIEAAPAEIPAPSPIAPAQGSALLGASIPSGVSDPNISSTISNELFTRMSDLEKQTTLLNLELKKERVANEIAAVKAQRQRAQEEEDAKREQKERERIEWQNEQDRLMVEEQRKLKETEIAMEKLRQEKVVKAYKETMLASTQKWIKKNSEIYAEMAKKDKELKDLIADYKNKLSVIQQKAEETKTKAEAARINHDKKVANLESQISILKTRLEAEIEKAKRAKISKSSKKNPFAGSGGVSGSVAPEKVKLSREYAIMEISGQGEDLTAKLINEDGDVFMAKVGTTLRNGYTIDEITQTFLGAVKDNDKDYLYFSAGGVLDHEPLPPSVTIKETNDGKNGGGKPRSSSSSRGGPAKTSGIPSLGRGMIVK